MPVLWGYAGLFLILVGIIVFLVGEAYFLQYLSGVNTSDSNVKGSEAGMAIGYIVYFIGVFLYSIFLGHYNFLFWNIIILAIYLLQLAEYYGMANQQKQDPNIQQGVWAATGIGLILLFVIVPIMYFVGRKQGYINRINLNTVDVNGLSITDRLAAESAALQNSLDTASAAAIQSRR